MPIKTFLLHHLQHLSAVLLVKLFVRIHRSRTRFDTIPHSILLAPNKVIDDLMLRQQESSAIEHSLIDIAEVGIVVLLKLLLLLVRHKLKRQGQIVMLLNVRTVATIECTGGNRRRNTGNLLQIIAEPCLRGKLIVVPENERNLVGLCVSELTALHITAKFNGNFLHGLRNSAVKWTLEPSGKSMECLSVHTNDDRHSSRKIESIGVFVFFHTVAQGVVWHLLLSFYDISSTIRCRMCSTYSRKLP